MIYARQLAALGIVAALGACATETAPSPLVMVVPGQGKDAAAFQQDDLICRHHATAHTGYSQPPANADGNAARNDDTSAAASSPDIVPADQIGYVQCMAARGDTVRPESPAYAGVADPDDAAYPYGYGYPYAYGYPYSYGFGYPYPFYGGGFVAGFGWGGWHRGGGYYRGWGHGFANSGYGHGGYGHGGFGHGGSGHGGGGGHR